MKLYMHPISMTSRPVRLLVRGSIYAAIRLPSRTISEPASSRSASSSAVILRPIPIFQRWLGNIKKLPSWGSVNQEFYGLQEMIKAQSFVRI
jgi:hypothetical protein